MKQIYIGAETAVTPLAANTGLNFERMLEGQSAIQLHRNAGWKGSDVYLARMEKFASGSKFGSLLRQTFSQIQEDFDPTILTSGDTLLIISSTKGELEDNPDDPFHPVVSEFQRYFALKHRPLVFSNACITGVLAINKASELVEAKAFKHVIVLGCDIVSGFVLYGFQSLFAVSDQPCRPFDLHRNGISLGEGSGAVVVSSEKRAYRQPPFVFLGGGEANDANHISGPSRTGEGLFRAVTSAMKHSGCKKEDIGYINAHGTGTQFNDEMESIAFDRAGLSEVPLNSLKGYLGHTLGAAGVLETVLAVRMMRNKKLVPSMGFLTPGTSRTMNVLTEKQVPEKGVFLKTASGFGGGNAAIILSTE